LCCCMTMPIPILWPMLLCSSSFAFTYYKFTVRPWACSVRYPSLCTAQRCSKGLLFWQWLQVEGCTCGLPLDQKHVF
jgi:hypothetical protein